MGEMTSDVPSHWDLALPTGRHPTTTNLILDTYYLFHYELCISFGYD
jgi:hypothetical protein